MGKKQNQFFTFIPHGKLIDALRTKCARAGIEFVETEESYTSKTDHLALEPMGEKPEEYQWLGSRGPRGRFRSSVGTILQADVNGCIGLGRKVGGEQWLGDFIQRLGTLLAQGSCLGKSTSNGVGPVPSPAAATRTHAFGRPERGSVRKLRWLRRDSSPPPASPLPGSYPSGLSPRRPNRLGPQPELCNKSRHRPQTPVPFATQYWSATMKAKSSCSPARCVLALRRTHVRMFGKMIKDDEVAECPFATSRTLTKKAGGAKASRPKR